MASRSAQAKWHGTLNEGSGTMALGSGAFEGPYNWRSRAEDGEDSNPEELIAAAHAGCFTMMLANVLGDEVPESRETDARVSMRLTDHGPTITKITLKTRGRVPGIDQETFERIANESKEKCVISRALAGIDDFTVEATLES